MKRNTTSRARLLGAAEEVFYARGIATTAVDVVARAAGVAKPTLYAHFASKSALAAAALANRHERRAADLQARLEEAEPGEPRLLAVFSWLASCYRDDNGRGCAFLNAAADSPADEPVAAAVREEKTWLLNTLTRLSGEAGLVRPAEVASQLLLLIDGVAGRVLVRGADAAADVTATAARAAAVLIEAARPQPWRA
ncbi:AcrR family transcriptional regulator [Streptomyces sp. V3I8]|uniref:TetR/AcrR family transcriptional regulator n=1 Tax=Streptomyces sp. V3I8 TaxID=3042279 RepID=UPI00278B9EC7|nr:TetR/AcrR family transcriptional regulator [Streptomyces sp. V3I8]MDQ1041258.1 AcrR family transcriptional regulator [Streptomyces sp. V3I8]